MISVHQWPYYTIEYQGVCGVLNFIKNFFKIQTTLNDAVYDNLWSGSMSINNVSGAAIKNVIIGFSI